MMKTGQMVMTRSIHSAAVESQSYLREVTNALDRYRRRDWGEISESDKKMNWEALIHNDRIFAAYKTSKGKIYIITEADRSVTTVLFAHEY